MGMGKTVGGAAGAAAGTAVMPGVGTVVGGFLGGMLGGGLDSDSSGRAMRAQQQLPTDLDTSMVDRPAAADAQHNVELMRAQQSHDELWRKYMTMMGGMKPSEAGE